MIGFHVRLADLTVAVTCQFESTRSLCRGFLTEPGPSAAEITLTPAHIRLERSFLRGDEPLGATTDEALERLALLRCLAQWLPGQDRVLFHGSCLAYDGRGVLFSARSGTGKSTHTRLWRECFGARVEMINDDKPFLHVTEAGTMAYGTPWLGKHQLGGNLRAPLAAICVVCRGRENRLERLNPRQALPLLLSQTYSPADPGALTRTLALADRLARTVAVYRLYCNMDPQAAVVARDGIFTEG